MLKPLLTSIEMFWRAANFLTVGMLYLEGNPLLREELRPEHLKQTIHGHWGACPAVNAIYGHVSDLSRRTGQKMQLVIGSGHAGPAILSCLFLEGTLEKIYPQYSKSLDGLTSLLSAFGAPGGFSTEISPEYPGAIYSGGEIGGALAFSQGYVLRNPGAFCVCVIGDGELESSATKAAWQGFKFLSARTDGRVLPVVNANGYKMGSQSVYALSSREDNASIFESYGLLPIVVGTEHGGIAAGFDTAYRELMSSPHSCLPVIILESPKGWSGPSDFGGRPFVGTLNSHKPLLRKPSVDHSELKMIEAWLLSYRPSELFDALGKPHLKISRCLPSDDNLLGNSYLTCQQEMTQVSELSLGNVRPIEAVATNLVTRVRDKENIVVFSPDELSSNGFSELLSVTKLKYGGESQTHSSNGQVVEILNEHLCFLWAQGLSMAGNRAVFVSYEAFAPMIESMLAQHLKFLKRNVQLPWRTAIQSINIIITSLGWHNTPTHHNPGFVDSLIGRHLKHVSIYMPVTAHAANSVLDHMLESVNRVNIMVLSKHQFSKLRGAALCDSGERRSSWRLLTIDEAGHPAVSLVALGDCMAEEALLAVDIIKQRCPSAIVQVIAVEKLNCMDDPEDPDRISLLANIGRSLCRLFVYNGYPTTIQGVLWGMGLHVNTTVLGYCDEDYTPSGESRFKANGVSCHDIAEEAIKLVTRCGQVEESQKNKQ